MATPDTAQKIRRRVYADDGSLLREGMVNKDIPNERQALLAFWQEQDAAEAQAAADEAAAEAERLAAMEQQPTNGESLAIPALQQRLDDAEAVLEQHADLLGTLQAAVPEETLRLASQIQLAAGSAAAVEATAQQAQAQIKTVCTETEARLAELDTRTAGIVAQVADLVTGGRQQLERTSTQIEADARRQIAQLVTTTTARVADMRGPKGQQGNPGASTVIGAGIPEGPSVMEPLIGRGAVVGDCYIDAQDPRRRAYRWDGSAWEPGPEMVSLELRDVRVQSLSTGNTVLGGGGGGSAGGGSATGSDPLMVRTAAGTAGSSTQIADSSRWSVPLAARGLPIPSSARVALQLTAADGGQAGKSLFILAGLLYEPGGVSSVRSRYTEFSLLGDLKDNVEVDLTMQIQGAAAPGGLSVSVPAGVNAAAIYLSITKNTVLASRFILSGACDWLLSQDANPDASHPSLLPAWQL